jgi:hypothetical protein
MIALLRVVHSFVALLMIASVVAVYYSAATRTYSIWLYLAVAALLIEGIVLVLNKGDCPFSYLSRRYGDTKAFFELFLPKKVAKQMFKVSAAIVAIGGMLLLSSVFV